jgi:hypothetical protein
MKAFLLLSAAAVGLVLTLGLHADACHHGKHGGRRGAGCSGQAASYGCSTSAVIAAPAPKAAGCSQQATACSGSTSSGCSGGRRLLFWRR